MRAFILTGGFQLLLCLSVETLFAADKDRITDQVAVTIVGNRIYAATTEPGFLSVELSGGEEVQAVEARGLNALVQTSERLLGFSAEVRRWSVRETGNDEQVVERRVTPRLIFVRTNKRLYGFLAQEGHWGGRDLSPQEEHRSTLIGENLAVVVTSRRVMAFSAFTGGFFSHDLSVDEKLTETTVNDNIVVLSTPKRRLIFRSHLSIWAELQ
jgi:hypothetical protein